MRVDDPEAIVDAAYAAWALQDAEAWLAYCADDVVVTLHVPTDILGFAGTSVGKAAARKRFARLYAEWDILEHRPGPLQVDGPDVRASVRFRHRHRPTGEVLEGRKRNVWRVEDGKVQLYETFMDADLIGAFIRLRAAERA